MPNLWNFAIQNFYNKKDFTIHQGDLNAHTTSGIMLWCESMTEANMIISRFRLWKPVLLSYQKCVDSLPEIVIALDIDWELWDTF